MANPNALAQLALVKPGEAWVPDFSATPIDLPASSIVYTQTAMSDGSLSPCLEGMFWMPVTLTPLRMVPLSGFAAPFQIQ
jgi:hypothetical protein